uniref:Uncharacterized protein n=1 Tax=Trichogramma kaykai TaxID=54128 RepID=A0ABD2WED4_9HYME
MERTGPIQTLNMEELKIINKWRFIRDLLLEYLDTKFATVAIIQSISMIYMVPNLQRVRNGSRCSTRFEGKNIATLHAIIRRHNRTLEYGKKMRIIVHCTFFMTNCSYGAYLIFGTIAIKKISWKTDGALAVKNLVTFAACSSDLFLCVLLVTIYKNYHLKQAME